MPVPSQLHIAETLSDTLVLVVLAHYIYILLLIYTSITMYIVHAIFNCFTAYNPHERNFQLNLRECLWKMSRRLSVFAVYI